MLSRSDGLMAFAYYPNAWEIAAQLELPPSQRLVLLALCDYADKPTGRCYPSHAALAKYTGLSPRTVGSAVRELDRTHGLIERTHRKGTSDLIRVLIPKRETQATVADPLAEGQQEVPTPSATVAYKPRNEPRKPLSNQLGQSNGKRPGRTYRGPCASTGTVPADPDSYLSLVDSRPDPVLV